LSGAASGYRPRSPIVADFPLVNKSFNLSYASADV